MVFAEIGYCIAIWTIIWNCSPAKTTLFKIGCCNCICARHIRHNHAQKAQIKICINPRTARGNGNRPYSAVPYTLFSGVQIYVLPHRNHQPIQKHLYRYSRQRSAQRSPHRPWRTASGWIYHFPWCTLQCSQNRPSFWKKHNKKATLVKSITRVALVYLLFNYRCFSSLSMAL